MATKTKSKKKVETNLPVLRVNQEDKLPDNAQYENRFYVRSASSDNLYVVAQNKVKRGWSCSCGGWIIHRHCKHLDAMSLPAHSEPLEVKMLDK